MITTSSKTTRSHDTTTDEKAKQIKRAPNADNKPLAAERQLRSRLNQVEKKQHN